jgi:hypothetical protein
MRSAHDAIAVPPPFFLWLTYHSSIRRFVDSSSGHGMCPLTPTSYPIHSTLAVGLDAMHWQLEALRIPIAVA